MSTSTLITVAPTGRTIAKAYTRGTDALATNGNATSLTYGLTNANLLTIVWTDLADGDYDFILTNAGGSLSSDILRVSGVTAILLGDREYAELNPATSTKIDSILEDTGTTLPGLISSVTITETGFGHINSSGTLLLKRGHTATVTFTSDTADIVPDLSAGTTKVFLGIQDTAGRQWLSLEGTVVTATGIQSISFTIPAAKAAALVLGVQRFDVIAVYGYAAGSPPTYTGLEPFASGNVTVHELSLDLTNI